MFQNVKLAIPDRFMEGIFRDTKGASELWSMGQGRHVCGPLSLSRIFNNLRFSHFNEDKIARISDWQKIPVVGTATYM